MVQLTAKIMFQIAPVIHEWTYDAMCHDLLELDGNKYAQEVYICLNPSFLTLREFRIYNDVTWI